MLPPLSGRYITQIHRLLRRCIPKGRSSQVERASEAQVGVAEGDQAMLEGECGVARIEQGSADLQVDVQQFESRKEAQRYRFQTTVK